MPKSWEFTEEQKQEIMEKQREIGAQFNPDTGRRWGETTENTGDGEDTERVRERIDDDQVR